MDRWTCPFLRVRLFQSLNGAPEYNKDSIKPQFLSHCALLSLPITPYITVHLPFVLESVLKASWISPIKTICNMCMSICETECILFERTPTKGTNKTRHLTYKLIKVFLSIFIISFRKTDLRHGWPLYSYLSPFLPHSNTHRCWCWQQGIKQTWQPGLFPGPVASVV